MTKKEKEKIVTNSCEFNFIHKSLIDKLRFMLSRTRTAKIANHLVRYKMIDNRAIIISYVSTYKKVPGQTLVF